ncbi:MAG: hypothetical protein C4520_06495 [Candidatus Abyssobacteria bacterium SURF_5]|uniref:Thioredoxin n=1 Tax=Abyssobacteria bacterium (strain SURF_5) TaxID=2093360 RepID=A0A3A4NXL0_ABYX5|nr:MAG: hypothetical protein C4520_06495 [Candidatus Abyssubacteria bacterium SURF_5]
MSGDADAQQEFFYGKGWTDGLPVIPPTRERVEAMLLAAGREPEEVLGEFPPVYAAATVEKIATNTVMAGCLPSYFPVVLAAVEAMMEDQFNLYGIQTTTHPCSPLIIVNGPLARELGINSKGNCFGQGSRANAVIGRAVRLAMQNVGGGIPGELDKATMGHPGKYSYCMAENEEESPWEPLHVERGFDRTASTVTVVAAEPPHNINDHGSTTAEAVLTTICGAIGSAGNNNLYRVGDLFVVLGPEHAATIAAGGFSKKDVQEYIFEHARVSTRKMSAEQLSHIQAGREDFVEPDGTLRVAQMAGAINVIVAGGPGKHSMWIPTFGITYSVTRAIRPKGV